VSKVSLGIRLSLGLSLVQFLANVNSRSRSEFTFAIYAVARPSVCLSVVCRR